MISSKPCGATVMASPNHDICDDCQGIRALCGVSPCPHAPPFTQPRDADISAFYAWLEAGGRAARTANNFATAAQSALRAGATTPEQVTQERFPTLKPATVEKYRLALTYYTAFRAGAEPIPLKRLLKKTVMTKTPAPEKSHNLDEPAPIPVPVVAPPPTPTLPSIAIRDNMVTVTLPFDWIDSVAADRFGFRVAVDVPGDPWIEVDGPTFRHISALFQEGRT